VLDGKNDEAQMGFPLLLGPDKWTGLAFQLEDGRKSGNLPA
jgi:hypothetical protein